MQRGALLANASSAPLHFEEMRDCIYSRDFYLCHGRDIAERTVRAPPGYAAFFDRRSVYLAFKAVRTPPLSLFAAGVPIKLLLNLQRLVHLIVNQQLRQENNIPRSCNWKQKQRPGGK